MHHLKHNDEANKQPGKSHVILVATILVILTFVILHATAAISVFHADLGSFSINNPIFYLAIGFILVIVIFKVFLIFKFKHFLGFMHGKKKL